MRKIFTQLTILLLWISSPAQNFSRSELPAVLISPWEIIYGPDGFLWLTESGGKVSRVDPVSGAKVIVYTAPDYFAGSPLEKSPLCFQPDIGVGTLGMALHPDFMNPSTSYIYFVYSYNSGTSTAPVTKFKIERLQWSASTNSIISNTTLVPLMPTGYDHLGGRLMIIKQNNVPYLFFTVGDNGISSENEPTCYSPQSSNPNNFAQDPAYKNGKVHRFKIDGSVPPDNPIAGNSFYTRGHRNPQGLIYNSNQNIIYDVEHGDRTDDEINILEAGMNYGWKNVRGFHADTNYAGESSYISNYIPDPAIANDALKEPMLTWCSTPQPTNTAFLDWCTVAPSDGIYYGSTGIPDWTNSLLVVTLKNGLSTDQEVYQFKLNANGKGIVPSTTLNPNPRKFFGEDQALNGRLRDITFSPDGTKIFLISNGGNASDRITVYTYSGPSGLNAISQQEFYLEVYPNPNYGSLTVKSTEELVKISLADVLGQKIRELDVRFRTFDVTNLPTGTYYMSVKTASGKTVFKKLLINRD